MALLDEGKETKSTPTCPKRLNLLPNFPLPTLNWTKRRRTRRMRAFAAGARSSSCGEKRRFIDSDGIASMREKFMPDLKIEVHRINNAIFSNEKKKEDEGKALMPWNLRKRSCSSVTRDDGAVKVNKELKSDDKKQWRSSSEKTERVKYSIELSKKEIEEDFMKMLGQKPPRRPNKRPRAVQNQLDRLFPRLPLMEATADSYKVLADAEKRNVRRSVKKKA